MTRHVPDGILRRVIDEPFSISDKQRHHYQSCARCQAKLTAIRHIGEDVAVVMALDPMRVDASTALGRFRKLSTQGKASQASPPLPRLRSSLLGNRAVGMVVATAVLAIAMVATPAGSWASGVFSIFQPKQFVALPVNTGELRTLPNLSHYGTLTLPQDTNSEAFSSISQADAAAGQHIVVPSYVPTGTPTKRTIQVEPSEVSTFTFDAAKAKAYASTHDAKLPPMPANVNGSTVRLTTKAAALTIYGPNGDIPQLVIGQTPMPSVTATGASFKAIEDYLLDLPGISKQLVKEIRSIGQPSSTLPIPVPINRAFSQQVTVQGESGLAVGDNTGVASLVIWQKHGIVYGVGGQLTQSQVLRIANSLH